MTVEKKTISRWPDKFSDTFPKNIETARAFYVMIKFIPLSDSWQKEKVFKKLMSYFKERSLCIFPITQPELLEGTSLKR